MSPDNSPTSTTAVQTRLSPGRGVSGVDAVKVDPSTFGMTLFMASAARKEFTRERIADADKPQKLTRDGVPVWSVQVSGINWRGNPVMLSVTVPAAKDPAEFVTPGQPVVLRGLVFGVTPKRDGSGFVTWCSADAVEPMKVSA